MADSQSSATDPSRSRLNPKQTKFLIGGVILTATIAYLVISAVGGSASLYLTVEELIDQGPSAQKVRVAGTIVSDSIIWESRDLLLQFEIADPSGILPVVHHGPRPDMFRDGAELVIEGRYTSEGIFEASTLLLKCPSKYDEASSSG